MVDSDSTDSLETDTESIFTALHGLTLWYPIVDPVRLTINLTSPIFHQSNDCIPCEIVGEFIPYYRW